MRNHFHFLLLLLLSVCPPSAVAQTAELQKLYADIDEAIIRSPQYVARHEARISEVRTAFQKERSTERRLMMSDQLFELYKAYDNDSALFYIQQYIAMADSLGRRQQADQGRARMAFQCSTVGLYTESLVILHDIQAGTLTRDGQADYYMACIHVCGELGYYTRVESMRDYYYNLRNEYLDSLFAVADPTGEDVLLRRESQLLNEMKYDEALKVNDRRMAKVEEGSRDYAIVCYYRHLIFNAQQRQADAKLWLARSALSDVRNAVMDQASLISLAELLNADGDFDRSYRYIQFTWECNNRFNTRMRSWQISPILTVIENNYQNQIRRSTRVLVGSMVAVSVLALLLLGVLLFLHRRNKQLYLARNEVAKGNEELTQKNEELGRTNGELQQKNAELDALNSQFQVLNAQLSESNRVKEEYIGRFMSLCSQYINKLDDYRKMVNRKMKNKELDELFRLSKSTELKEKELDELYENFDHVFLHLFPNFVDDFNALLTTEVQVHPKEENRLNTDLRIFALIRLGIEDSGKIAEFLHYSVNTIYNYRARIKNGAVGNREHFEQQVKQLGSVGV